MNKKETTLAIIFSVAAIILSIGSMIINHQNQKTIDNINRMIDARHEILNQQDLILESDTVIWMDVDSIKKYQIGANV